MSEKINIYAYYKSLSIKNKKLLNEYINRDYVSGVRTGKGKRKNFFEEHNSLEGLKVVKEILKLKRLENKIHIAEKKFRKK